MFFVRLPGGAFRSLDAHPEDPVASLCGAGAGAALQGTLRVVYAGRTLHPWASLARQGVPAGATLELLPRLLGGGGDGGSTGAESRSCYLEMYAGRKADKVNPEEERLARWTTCQLSGMPLAPPCVADELGSLYNKDAALQALLNKSIPKSLNHISSLKHLIELKLEPAASGGRGDGDGTAQFACPITSQPLNGKSRFVIFRKSGHVISERALKEVPAVVEDLVGGKWEAGDVLPVNPSGEELQTMRENLMLKRAAERVAKKERKGNKAAAAAANGHSNGSEAAANGGAAGGKRAAESSSNGHAAAANGQNGDAPAAADIAAGKRFKAAELKPKEADEKIWNSLFTSSRAGSNGGSKGPDYMCRAATRYVM